MATTRKNLFNEAGRLDVEIDETNTGGYRHLHAWAPEGSVFRGSSVHSSSLWDCDTGARPDWKSMLDQIQLEPCYYGPECDYCHPKE
tara:strand:+ start:452 stop:712 length:261 start_codon:yes stop_codon:yes gene_type:complete